MIEGLFGQNNCGCGNNGGYGNKNDCCGFKFNLGGTSSCKVLIYLIILYFILNCGLLSCGLDICTLLILIMFICMCGKKGCNR